MKRSTHYAIMFFVACSLTGIAINGPEIYGWALSLDACSVLLACGIGLLYFSFVGKSELSNEEKMEKKLHDHRKEDDATSYRKTQKRTTAKTEY